LDYPVKQDAISPAYNDSLSDIAPNLKPWYLHYYIPTLQKKQFFWQNNLNALKKNSSYRIEHNKNYQAFLKNGGPSSTEEEGDFGKEDLQMQEALNIMKDMIVLQSQQRK